MENTIDWSATAAWIALAVAIISPIITTIISNCHQSKMKKLEIIEKRGLEVIEEYLSITSREILTTGISDDYIKSYIKIFLYAPKSLYNDLEKLNDLIHCSNGQFPDKKQCAPLLLKISKSLLYKNI